MKNNALNIFKRKQNSYQMTLSVPFGTCVGRTNPSTKAILSYIFTWPSSHNFW